MGRSAEASHRLVLLRHGRSTGYAEDTFSGWLDVPLSEEGRREATRAGELLVASGLVPDVVHTSLLSRARSTAELLLTAARGPGVPVRATWRLNERHYGALQGRSRGAVRAEVGDRLYRLWRRSYEHAPPPAPATGRLQPEVTEGMPEPSAESLADVRRRLEPCWYGDVVPDLRAGRTVLVVGHSNSLRALCMVLDDLSPAEVTGLDLPTGIPLRYDLDSRLLPLHRGGTWLDPAAAAAGTAEVRAQGRCRRRVARRPVPHPRAAMNGDPHPDGDPTSEEPA